MAGNIGFCKFCGQTVQLDKEYDTSVERDAAAADRCSCIKADMVRRERIDAKRRDEHIEQAISLIERYFPSDDEQEDALTKEETDAIVMMINAAVIPAVDGFLSKVTVSVSRVKGTVAAGVDGKIKVERVDTRKVTGQI